MGSNTEYLSGFVRPVLLLAASLVSGVVSFIPAHSVLPVGLGDGMLLALLAIHFVWGLHLGYHNLVRAREEVVYTRRAAEGLFFFGTFLFIFAYVYASNANMDYVQRYAAGGGTIRFAPDTRTERLLVAGRYLPFLGADLLVLIAAIRKRHSLASAEGLFAPSLMLLAVALSVLSNPSFLHVEGFGWLGWVSLVPLFVLVRCEVAARRPGRAIWYGVLYGVLFTLIGNYWLGTFNLISLQAVGVIFLAFYGIYTPIAVGALMLVTGKWAVVPRFAGGRLHSLVSRLRPLAGALILPLSWSFFELARSTGFLGYPWLLVAHSQYRAPVMIQLAEVGGVWLVSFVVLLVNAFIAEALSDAVRRDPRSYKWLIAAASVIAINVTYGIVRLGSDRPVEARSRIALVQQNNDPRKHEYRATFDTLRRLTDEALAFDPDLVVWSETAFVPNIRRWSEEDPRRYDLAALVEDLLEYFEAVDTWLLTGNDDYRRVFDDSGEVIDRNSFNAAVLFSDDDRRVDTYHKVKLVPFTEHFPYQEQLPWVYDLLMAVDIFFWTPGEEYVVFSHPKFDFATPICFEDAFPGAVRRFALEGMEVIVNITNDYWSLREQAARQHFAAAIFRSVELGVPMVRATASGVTSHIDDRGRIVATAPQYSEEFLIADIAIAGGEETVYRRFGDWMPVTAGIAVLLIVVVFLGLFYSAVGRTRRWK